MLDRVMTGMIEYFGRDARRIHHFMKVYGFARAIALSEGVDDAILEIIELAALTHDIGIKPSEEKYSSSAGHYQQIEGPGPARALLKKAGYPDDVVERVAFLIAHHHTYSNISGMDYQILVEADFLVNIYEEGMDRRAVQSAAEKIFRTAAGLACLESMYLE